MIANGNQRGGHGIRPLAGAAGFTLVELLVVMAIVVVLAAVTVPYARNSYRGLQLEDAARTLGARIGAARALAVQMDRPVRFRIDQDGRQHWIEVATNVLGTEFVRASGFHGQSTRLPDGVDWGTIELGGMARPGADEILFDPSHSWPAGRIWLVGATERYLITCRPGTGRVRVHREMEPGRLEPPEEPAGYEELLDNPL